MILMQAYAGKRRRLHDNSPKSRKGPDCYNAAGTGKFRASERRACPSGTRQIKYLITAIGEHHEPACQRRRVIATPSRNAIHRLVSGASRVTLRSLASGWPGCCACSIADRNRSTATCNPAVSSSIVCDTSVAVSMARSAMLGANVGSGALMSTGVTFQSETRGRHLWLSARALVLNSGSEDLWLSATGAVLNGG